jgi:DNA ligase D-like protein (predicted 3'-phosphoesterase)
MARAEALNPGRGAWVDSVIVIGASTHGGTMSTRRYRSKRDFSRTKEPEGNNDSRGSSESPRFVIQKHDASTLHYDFRLEIDGVLKSWAVPKGPSTDPADKRLAVPTEDHPLEYADFEGVIPADEYGGGTVMIWDRGPFRNITEKEGELQPLEKAWRNGHVLVELKGEKISGGYALHRTGSSDDANWLLIKMDDDEADARRNPVSTEPKSVESGRTMREIVAGDDGNDA